MSRNDDQSPDTTAVERGTDSSPTEDGAATTPPWLEQLAETERRIAALEEQLAAARPTKTTPSAEESPVPLTLVASPEPEDSAAEAPRAEATKEADQIIADAREQATVILGEARREAFRFVTEARQDAENTAAEAQANAGRILAGAEEVLATARRDAISLIDEVKAESEQLVAERNKAFEQMRADYETENADLLARVSELRSIATDLESRLEAVSHPREEHSPADPVAEPVAESVVEPSPPLPPEPDSESPSPAASDPTEDDAASIEINLEAPTANPETEEIAPQASPRGSFYSRRSAKLPRIGPDAGRNAIAAITAMRAHAKEAGSHDYEEESSPQDKEGVTARTA